MDFIADEHTREQMKKLHEVTEYHEDSMLPTHLIQTPYSHSPFGDDKKKLNQNFIRLICGVMVELGQRKITISKSLLAQIEQEMPTITIHDFAGRIEIRMERPIHCPREEEPTEPIIDIP